MSIKNYAVFSAALVASLFVTNRAHADTTIHTGNATNNANVNTHAGTNELHMGGGQGGSTHVEVSDNGAFSDNTVTVNSQNTTTVNQTNNTVVNNDVTANSNTGNNSASYTSRGDTEIHTGNATNNVSVETTAGKNVLHLNCATCNNSTHVEVSDNGAFSDNKVTVHNKNDVKVNQTNNTHVTNTVDVNSNTGNNQASGGYNYDHDNYKNHNNKDKDYDHKNKDYDKKSHDYDKHDDKNKHIAYLVYLCQMHDKMYFDYHDLTCKYEKKDKHDDGKKYDNDHNYGNKYQTHKKFYSPALFVKSHDNYHRCYDDKPKYQMGNNWMKSHKSNVSQYGGYKVLHI